MSSISYTRGDIIEYENETFRVWEINGDYYGLLPIHEGDDRLNLTPYYVPRTATFRLIRRRIVNPLHSVPPNARFLVETCPHTEYDLTKLRLWTDDTIGHVELHHTRMSGVFGSTDGSLTQRGKVEKHEITRIKIQLEEMGFWQMDVKVSRPELGTWWVLTATDGTRTHSVERFGDVNEIREICEQCYRLIDWNNLESDPFDIT